MIISVIVTLTIGLVSMAPGFVEQASCQTRRQSDKQAKPADFKKLMIVPPDSAEAERVRIWVPQEGIKLCSAVVNILDNSGKVIRHLVNSLLYQNYYNFYWDKKDNEGNYVDSGFYKYTVNDCGGNKNGEVEARFKKWELLSRILPFDTATAGRVDIDLLADSALVSIEIKYRTGRLADTPITDSLFMSGHHTFNWTPAPETRPGQYWMTVRVGDFEQTSKFMYRKNLK